MILFEIHALKILFGDDPRTMTSLAEIAATASGARASNKENTSGAVTLVPGWHYTE
jgi:hypothetical protein